LLRVDLNRHATRQAPRKRTVATGRLEHAAMIPHQRQHATNNGVGRKYLAELSHVQSGRFGG
jgi:hypothetical protein